MKTMKYKTFCLFFTYGTATISTFLILDYFPKLLKIFKGLAEGR